jgi:hypothetical protein
MPSVYPASVVHAREGGAAEVPWPAGPLMAEAVERGWLEND